MDYFSRLFFCNKILLSESIIWVKKKKRIIWEEGIVFSNVIVESV